MRRAPTRGGTRQAPAPVTVRQRLKWPASTTDHHRVTVPFDAPERAHRDAGLGLVEVMVALVLFALMGTGVIVTITRANALTYEDAARTAATNLAVREVEITRDVFSSTTRGPDDVLEGESVNSNPLPGGTANQPLVVDGTAFTVRRDVELVNAGETGSACDQSAPTEKAVYKVVVEVSWEELGKRPPVRMATTMTAPKGTNSGYDGHIGVKIVDRYGLPVRNMTVTATSSSQTESVASSADGCALITGLTPGTFTITMNRPGYVNPAGDPTAKMIAQVQTRQLWRGTIEYDAASSIVASFTTRSGYSIPTGVSSIPISLGNSAITPGGSRAVTGTGTTRTMGNLWPYPSGYEIWAGNCVDNDPGDFREAPVASEPLLPGLASVPLAPLRIKPSGSGTQTITATHDADSSCASGMTVTLGSVSGGDAELRSSLPYGTWTIRRSGGGGGKTVTLAAPDPDASGPAPTPPEVKP